MRSNVVRQLLWLLPLLLCLASPAGAAEYYADYNGALSFDDGVHVTTLKNLPRFEDYHAEHAPRSVAKDIDFKSNKAAWGFRTRLRNGLRAGPNFNGHYNVVVFGCGTFCQVSKIVDIETGRVTDGWTTGYLVGFRKDSRLIVPNLPSRASVKWIEYCYLGEWGLTFYSFKKDRLDKVYKADLTSAWKPYRTRPCADF